MGRFILAICAAASLSGCVTRPPLTAEQRQFWDQYFLAQQARYQPPQPYYMPMPAQSAPARNCMSNVTGITVYTNCY